MNRISRIRLKQLIGPKLYSQLWEFTSFLHGVDQYRDLAKRLPAFAPRTIFDIGANIGQSADRLMRWYPDASIHCFEPADSTYKMLAANMRPFSRVHCHRLAISSGSGTAKMLVYGPGDVANRLQADTVVCDDGKRPGFEDVDVTTVDAFCEQYQIDVIDYLKIDAEGHDLAVLQGADKMLTPQRCGIVQVECGMNPSPAKHIGYAELDSHLRDKGFILFGIYMQANGDPAWPVLTHADWVFVNEQLLRHPRKPLQGGVTCLPLLLINQLVSEAKNQTLR